MDTKQGVKNVVRIYPKRNKEKFSTMVELRKSQILNWSILEKISLDTYSELPHPVELIPSEEEDYTR
jgi:hypothetical protein